MPPKQNTTLETNPYIFVQEGALPRWTRSANSNGASAPQNRTQKAHRGENSIESPRTSVQEVEDWEQVSDQSGDEANGTPEAHKRQQEITNKNRGVKRARDQTQRKQQQSEINRKAAERQKEWEARRTELKTWRQSGGRTPEPEKKEGWLSWFASYFQAAG